MLKSVTTAQDLERLDMRSGCHAPKILPIGVRGKENVWVLSSLSCSPRVPVKFGGQKFRRLGCIHYVHRMEEGGGEDYLLYKNTLYRTFIITIKVKCFYFKANCF